MRSGITPQLESASQGPTSQSLYLKAKSAALVTESELSQAKIVLVNKSASHGIVHNSGSDEKKTVFSAFFSFMLFGSNAVKIRNKAVSTET